MHGRPADFRRPGLELRPDFGVGTGQIRQAPLQGAEVQHGAADQQRGIAARADQLHLAQRIDAKLGRGIRLARITDIDQAVRRHGQGGGIGLGGADIHAAVHQRRIDADDLQRQPLHQFDREAGLAGRGRPHQKNGQRLVHAAEVNIQNGIINREGR